MIRPVKEGELGRKAIHYLSSLIPLIYQFCCNRNRAILITGILFIGMVVAELLRMHVPVLRRTYWRIFGGMIRRREFRNHFTGGTYVFLGSFLAVFLFPKEIAVTCLLFLTIGDPTACLVGLSIGRIKIFNNKTLEGAVAFVAASVLATFWIAGIPLWIKISGALVACFVEVIHRKIDDNVLIPLFSGTTMLFLAELFKIW
jgi:dolichol kinase